MRSSRHSQKTVAISLSDSSHAEIVPLRVPCFRPFKRLGDFVEAAAKRSTMSVTGGFPTASLAVAILFPFLGERPLHSPDDDRHRIGRRRYALVYHAAAAALARMVGKEGLSARDTFIERAAGRLTDKSGNQKLEFRKLGSI